MCFRLTLEKTEGTINNGQPRDTGNIWVHKTQDVDKYNKKHNTGIESDEQHGSHQHPGMNPGARRGYAVLASCVTPVVLLI